MLKKMLFQGLAAALLIGGAAAVYAQAQDNGYLAAPGPGKATEARDAKEAGTTSGKQIGQETRKGKHEAAGREREHHAAADDERKSDDD